VIAHNVSVMVVQASAANDVFDTRPDRVREALHAIERSGRDALAELRRLLGSVRGEGPDYAPQPGLDRLDALVAQVRGAGLSVAVVVDGNRRDLPAGVDLSAYRIVQEALTNTLRHARATSAEVTLRYGADELDVEIRDDGVSTGNGGGAGRGLIGMRERVAAYGGSLTAGPMAGGGFDVSARFPL
jgi:signal transduction histidine kinase